MRALFITLVCLWLAPGAAADTPAAERCAPQRGAGLHTLTIEVAGHPRDYLLYLPAGYDGTTGLPLLLALHGFGSDARTFMEQSDLNTLAAAEGVVVVYPQAMGQPSAWFTGTSILRPVDDTRDVAFLAQLVDHLLTTYCLDAGRVYVVGFSLGGGMAYRLACELPQRIAAFGVVAGAFATIPGGCQPQRPIAVMAIHGLRDRVVPFAGLGLFLPSASDWIRAWARRNACRQPATVPLGDLRHGADFSQCEGDVRVVLRVVPEAGHVWPGTPRPSRASQPSDSALEDVSASRLLWDFLSRYRLP